MEESSDFSLEMAKSKRDIISSGCPDNLLQPGNLKQDQVVAYISQPPIQRVGDDCELYDNVKTENTSAVQNLPHKMDPKSSHQTKSGVHKNPYVKLVKLENLIETFIINSCTQDKVVKCETVPDITPSFLGDCEEIGDAQVSCSDLKTENFLPLTTLEQETQCGGWKKRICDLEQQLDNERAFFSLSLKQRDDELITLRRDLEVLKEEHQALLEIKIILDKHIETYRRLLAEQMRLNSSATKKNIAVKSGSKKDQGLRHTVTQRMRGSDEYSLNSSATKKNIAVKSGSKKDQGLRHTVTQRMRGSDEYSLSLSETEKNLAVKTGSETETKKCLRQAVIFGLWRGQSVDTGCTVASQAKQSESMDTRNALAIHATSCDELHIDQTTASVASDDGNNSRKVDIDKIVDICETVSVVGNFKTDVGQNVEIGQTVEFNTLRPESSECSQSPRPSCGGIDFAEVDTSDPLNKATTDVDKLSKPVNKGNDVGPFFDDSSIHDDIDFTQHKEDDSKQWQTATSPCIRHLMEDHSYACDPGELSWGKNMMAAVSSCAENGEEILPVNDDLKNTVDDLDRDKTDDCSLHPGDKCRNKRDKVGHTYSLSGEIFGDCGNLETHKASHIIDKRYKCTVCGKIFRLRSLLSRHMTVHPRERSHKCTVCGSAFFEKSKLKRHLRIHTREKHICKFCSKKCKDNFHLKQHIVYWHSKIKCTICGEEFSGKIDLASHMRVHERKKAKDYPCTLCSKAFVSQGNRTTHMKWHENRPHRCTHCSASFNDSAVLQRHLLRHSGEKPYKCTVCHKGYKIKSKLEAHMHTHNEKAPTQKIGFLCSVCGKKFRESNYLYEHLRTHTGEKPFICNFCDKAFISNSMLKRHVRTHTGEKPFLCTFCGQSFLRKSNLQIHTRRHSAEKQYRYRCTVCNLGFYFHHQFKMHMMRHTGEMPFKCTICAKGFSCNSTLKYHMKSHTGEKPFKCTICAKGFSCNSTLKYHMNLHTGEYGNNKCTVCNKCFGNKKTLQNHLIIHSGERPYKCDVCGKTFNCRSNLRRHGRTHSGEKPYKCSTCGKGFIVKNAMHTHMRTHSGEKPYLCGVCGKAFADNRTLKKHNMRIHNALTIQKTQGLQENQNPEAHQYLKERIEKC